MIETRDPNFRLLRDELFGPVVTAYVYPEGEYEQTLELVDRTAPYGLTGAVFARDRAAIELAGDKLQYAAGNFYVNDKPTGAVVGQQPFGGARASGTNDKAGSMWNLIRWVSPAHDQGDVRAAEGLPLPVHGARRRVAPLTRSLRRTNTFSRRSNTRPPRVTVMRLLAVAAGWLTILVLVLPVKGF